MEAVLISLYSLLPLVALYSYMPQIMALRTATVEDCKAMSLLSWCIWSASSAIATFYGLLIVHDWRIAAANGITLACCALITGMIVRKRYNLRKMASIQVVPVITPDIPAA